MVTLTPDRLIEPRVIHGSVLDTDDVADDSVDLIVTSPPYNVGIGYNSHDDSESYTSYLEFTKAWLSRCFEFLKDDGRLCLNIPLDKNGGGQQSVYADMVAIAKRIGFRYHSTIVWNEQNISRRTAWGSWMSASAPYVIAPVEMVVILYKKVWKKTQHGQSDIARDDFIAWTNGVWSFNGEKKSRVGHPAPFPVELPLRCIKLFSYIGDVVLDPFLGSGTTLIACARTGRVGVGIDIDAGYCALALQRLATETGQPEHPIQKSQDTGYSGEPYFDDDTEWLEGIGSVSLAKPISRVKVTRIRNRRTRAVI